MRVLGLDIGGANIKASTADGESVSISFAIWQNRDGLRGILKQLPLYRDTPPDIVALTMTAELADCFQTKAEGVQFIIEAVQAVFAGSMIRVWLTSGEFAEAADAIELPQLAGASNWHALATWAGRAAPSGPAVLIEVGFGTNRAEATYLTTPARQMDLAAAISAATIEYLARYERRVSGGSK